jgi:hypothetical protein
MPQQIQWSVSIQIIGGPTASVSRSLAVEAYDSIKVGVAAPESDKEIQLQPGGTGQVKFLAITANRYGADLTYKVNAVANPAIPLDQPLVLTGDGAVGILDPAPATLFLSNASATEEALIQVLVGRDATP